jgi:hypothetical protein
LTRNMKKHLLKRGKAAVLKQAPEGGFTLTNLIIGAGLTLLVAAGGGGAVASMLDTTATSNARSERRVEMNRTLEFMRTEINRSERLIATANLPANFKNDLSTAQLNKIKDEVDVNSIQAVLQLKLPGANTSVTYFTATPKDGIWKGPKVLFRFGPDFLANGNYEDIDLASSDNWSPLPLLDRLESFSAPVPVTGETVNLQPVGKIQKLMGRSETYSVNLATGTKQQQIRVAAFNPSGGAGVSGTPATVIPFSLAQGNVKVAQTSTMKVEVLGGDIVCGDPRYPIPTQAKFDLSGGMTANSGWMSTGSQTWTNVPINTTLKVTAWAKGNNGSGSCKQFSYQANSQSDQTTQVLTVRNGDTVPQFKPYLGQRSIDTFLKPYVDTTTGKIKLAANQAIFLFELGTTDKNSPAYDMQDMVVLTTITPTVTTTTTSSTTTTSGTTTTASNGCNNGVGNGSEGCTPGKARPNDEVVRDAAGNIVCIPAPGSPCTSYSRP